MAEHGRRPRRVRELEQFAVLDHDSTTPSSADNRAAHALEHIASRMGRIDEHLSVLVGALAGLLNRDDRRH